MSGPYWQDTFNPVVGCTQCSPGCTNCWAKSMHERFSDRPFGEVRCLPEVLSKPLRRRKPTTYFVCNTSDLFHPSVPFDFVAQVWAAMILAHQHTFLVCTKRPHRMREALTDQAFYNATLDAANEYRRTFPKLFQVGISNPSMFPAKNIWLGVTVEDQERANERLFPCPDWISAEPLLGPIDFDFESWGHESNGPQGWIPGKLPRQVIVGGESGPNARPCDVRWIRDIVRQCREADVRCYVKQLGSASHDRDAMQWIERACLNPSEHQLMLGNRHVASAWATGCWHTWDKDGIGGWNNEAADLESAKRDAESAVIGQGWAPVRMRSRSGSDPSEWPEDLRVRELGWDCRAKAAEEE